MHRGETMVSSVNRSAWEERTFPSRRRRKPPSNRLFPIICVFLAAGGAALLPAASAQCELRPVGGRDPNADSSSASSASNELLLLPHNNNPNRHQLELHCNGGEFESLFSYHRNLTANVRGNISLLSVECAAEWTPPHGLEEIAAAHPADGHTGSSNQRSHAATPLRFPALRRLRMQGCGEAALRALADRLDLDGSLEEPLDRVDLRANGIRTMEWQLASRLNTRKLDLSNNPINCSCANRWLFDTLDADAKKQAHQRALMLHLPAIVTLAGKSRRRAPPLAKCQPDCGQEERTELQPPILNTALNSMAALKCRLGAPLPSNSSSASQPLEPERLFGWLMDTAKAREERRQRWKLRVESASVVRLEVWNLTSDDLGIVVCRCLHCVTPSFDTSQLLFETPVTTTLHSAFESTHLAVHGYPLGNLTMTIRRLADGREETRNFDQQHATVNSFFDATLDVRLEEDHEFNFLKQYAILMRPNASNADYEIRVCTDRRAEDCATLNATLKHDVLDSSNYGPAKSNRAGATSTFIYFVFVLLLVVAAGALTISTFHYYRRDKTASKLATAVGWHKKSRFRRTSRNTTTTGTTEATSLQTDDTFSATMSNYSLQHVPIIQKEHLILEEKIGKGAFGEVFTGEWLTRGVRVAVKILHNVQVDAQLDKEAAMLAALDHENVVKMFGVCKAAEQQSLYLVLELMNMGDLKTYVKQREPRCDNYSQFPPALLPTELINIAQQVCTGLYYLHSQQILHRDLAARNCLVSGESDLRICAAAFRPPVTVKISDFGMSRRLYSQADYYKMGDKKTALPVRWLPTECLESGRFTYQSDMWAFGVTLFEIFSFGAMPYGDLSNNEALMAVISGVRPTVPAKCPAEVGALMRDCWKTAPDERPLAEEALLRLKELQ